MKTHVPHYYNDFCCIADKCRDSCCIGWEIDIDSAALEMYNKLGGELGERLRANITRSEDGSDCFRLTEDERCPFLDENNLCCLILAGGDDMLCQICRMHPRFVNVLPNGCEMGIGLCCEEAARLIISDDMPFSLYEYEEDNEPCEGCDELSDFLYHIREYALKQLEKPMPPAEQTGFLLETGRCVEKKAAQGDYSQISGLSCEEHHPTENIAENIALIKALEPLNDMWNKVCGQLSGEGITEYSSHSRAYANLLKYFLFRYFMDSAYDGEIYLKCALAVFSADAVTYICSATGMSFIDSACLWSKEIEYSAENMEMIFNYLDKMRKD